MSTPTHPGRSGRCGVATAAVGSLVLLTSCAGSAPDSPPGAGGSGPTEATGPRETAVPTGLAAIADPADWPDACELGDGGNPGSSALGLSDARPELGELPDGTPLPGARECGWLVDDRGELTLRVVIVTADVLEAWAGYQYTAGLRRDVSNVGDEAFLVPQGVDGEERLWVCKGQTIFTLDVENLEPQESRQLMFDVARAASGELAATPAGEPPPGA